MKMNRAKWTRLSGFTLIELMITIVIVAILIAIALPSYTDYIQRSNRTEAMRSLIDIANMQEQYYLDYRRYATSTNELGLGVSYATQSGYYTIATSSADLTADFTLTANAQGDQADDTYCAQFTLASDGARGATNSDCWQ